DDYAAVTDRLARTFGAADCRVRTDPKRRGRVVLWLLIQDPLTDPVPPFEADPFPDLAALDVALGEDAQTYRLRLLGTHLLVAGATGSGKGSVLWSIVDALQHALRTGLVQLWVLDPKGGMEFAFGRALFTRFCYGDPDPDTADVEGKAYELGYARLLEDAVEVMRDRQQRLRGQTRLHTPTAAEPLIVVVIDELASLTAYATDRDAKKRIGSALALLLSQGRAVGVTVVGALQDPRKDVLPFRDLFPTRICLRVTEDEHVDMVLGPGARSRGARCDTIPESLPGVGYVGLDGVVEPIRVRFSHITDTHILNLAHTHGSTGRVRPVEGNQAERGGHDEPVAA
ncbi:MAG: FtsK/SpoIIIE domain-containing protein, partial [Micromonosporaceae bacterium]